MKVTRLAPYGFCPGVQEALKIAEEVLSTAKKDHRKVFLEHALVHNEEVEKKLKSIGDYEIYDGQVLNEKDIFLISAHGHDLSIDENLGNPQIISAFCFRLKERFCHIKEAVEKHCQILYLGEKEHPETRATLSYLDRELHYSYTFFSDANDLKTYLKQNSSLDNLLIVQSTFLWEENSTYPHLETIGTCPYCLMRQSKLRDSTNYSTYLVIGSQTSSNAKSLYKLAAQLYPKAHVYLVAKVEDLQVLKISEPILLLSGTSAPRDTVDEIYDYLKTLTP